jgi:hypothetical protein
VGKAAIGYYLMRWYIQQPLYVESREQTTNKCSQKEDEFLTPLSTISQLY